LYTKYTVHLKEKKMKLHWKKKRIRLMRKEQSINTQSHQTLPPNG